MIKSLQLKNSVFESNLIQGPLAGVSCAPFRSLTSRYGKPAFTCTEMISCKTLLQQRKEVLKRYISKDPLEGPVCFQLSGSNPIELAEATKIATDAGADLIDLNCGCPVKKIRSKGAGSSLLRDVSKLYQLIVAMKQNTHLPVSIKIRVDGVSDEKNNQPIVNMLQDAGNDFLIVHGRHWTEKYDTPCRYDEIQFFVENLSIPVIGNGDVSCVESLQKMFATGCAGVMIGRAGVGQPWLIAKLTAQMQQQEFSPPTNAQIGAMFLEHTHNLIALLEDETAAIYEARKFAKYYARGLVVRENFTNAVNACFTFDELSKITTAHFV